MSKSRAKRRRALRPDVPAEASKKASSGTVNGPALVNGVSSGSAVEVGVPGRPGDGDARAGTGTSFSAAETNARYLSADIKSVRGLFREVCSLVSERRATDAVLPVMGHCLSHLQCVGEWGPSLLCWAGWLVDLLHVSPGCLQRRHVLVCHVLGQVLTALGSDPPPTGQGVPGVSVPTALLTSVVSALVKCTDQADDYGIICSVFDCLRQVMVFFGRHCTAYKTEIQRCVTSYIDSEVRSISRSARRCYAVLYCVTTPGVAGAAVVSGWNQQISQLIFSTHRLLDTLFDGITEQQHYSIPDSPAIDDWQVRESADPLQQRRITCLRAATLLQLVIDQLSVSTLHPVRVPVTHLLHVVSRCVHVSSTSVKAVTMETSTVLEVVADLHAVCMRLLRKLIVSCGRALLLHSSLINQLLCTSLLAQSDAGSCSAAQNSAGKQAARALSVWLSVVGCASGFHDNASRAVKALLLGCSLMNDQKAKNIDDNQKSVPTNNKRKRGKLAADWSRDDQVIARRPITLSHAINRCCESVEALTQLVLVTGPLLGSDLHESLLLTVSGQLSNCVPSSRFPVFSSCHAPVYWKYRAGFYRLLDALVVSNCSSRPPPHHTTLGLARSAVFDTDPQVAAASVHTMAVWSRSVRPCYPSLEFPPALSCSEDRQHLLDGLQEFPGWRDRLAGDVSSFFSLENTSVNGYSRSNNDSSDRSADVSASPASCHDNSNRSVLGGRSADVSAPAASCHDNSDPSVADERSADVSALAARCHDNRDCSGIGGSCGVSECCSVVGGSCEVSDGCSELGVRSVDVVCAAPECCSVAGGALVSLTESAAVESTAVTTVTLCSSESSSGDEGSVQDIVLDSDSEPVADTGEVQFVGQQRGMRHLRTPPLLDDAALTPDVAEMLKDFVNADPEVE